MTMKTFELDNMPAPFCWHGEAPAWKVAASGSLCFSSGPRCDHFCDPASGRATASSPCALMALDEPFFVFGARAALVGSGTFDAAVLFARAADDSYAKLCLEISPAGDPMIVSVVTRGTSDDSNSVVLAAPQAYLRVARTPNTLAFHYSLDARVWHMVRYFTLGAPATMRVGFSAQSPLADGCEASFSEIFYRRGELADLRSGV